MRQNDKLLNKVNLTMLIDKQKWHALRAQQYSIEPRTRKYIKGYGFLSFTKNISNKYGKQLLDTATKTGLDALKSASKKVVHKAAEAIGEFIGNNIADKIVKPKPVIDANYRKY